MSPDFLSTTRWICKDGLLVDTKEPNYISILLDACLHKWKLFKKVFIEGDAECKSTVDWLVSIKRGL